MRARQEGKLEFEVCKLLLVAPASEEGWEGPGGECTRRLYLSQLANMLHAAAASRLRLHARMKQLLLSPQDSRPSDRAGWAGRSAGRLKGGTRADDATNTCKFTAYFYCVAQLQKHKQCMQAAARAHVS